jgi:hypothetical protein
MLWLDDKHDQAHHAHDMYSQGVKTLTVSVWQECVNLIELLPDS